MSTQYLSRKPMTIDEAAEKTGWRRADTPDGFTLTNGSSYIHVSEFVWEDKTYLDCERYGTNEVEEFVSTLNLISEHDEGFWELPWNITTLSCDICGKTILETEIHVNLSDEVVCKGCCGECEECRKN